MLIWQNYLHILRSLFSFIFLIFSICAGSSHHISSLLPKGICEGSWSCRNSNCSCSSCTWRLYRNFLFHWKKSSLHTIRTNKIEKSVTSLNTAQLKLCSLLSCQTSTKFSHKSSKSERLLWTKGGMKKWAKEFCQAAAMQYCQIWEPSFQTDSFTFTVRRWHPHTYTVHRNACSLPSSSFSSSSSSSWSSRVSLGLFSSSSSCFLFCSSFFFFLFSFLFSLLAARACFLLSSLDYVGEKNPYLNIFTQIKLYLEFRSSLEIWA